MNEKERRMLGWMKASCVWSIVTGVIALVLVGGAGAYAKYFGEPLWLYIVIGTLAVFGGMQIIDGLIRLDYNNKIKWALEDKVPKLCVMKVEDASTWLHERVK